MTTSATCTARNTGWPIQRILFLMAGSFTLVGAVLSATVSPWFLLLPTLVGANQLLMVVAGWCPASLILSRFGVADLRDRPELETSADEEYHVTEPPYSYTPLGTAKENACRLST